MVNSISDSPYAGSGWRLDVDQVYMANILHAQQVLERRRNELRKQHVERLRIKEWLALWNDIEEWRARRDWYDGPGSGEDWYRPMDMLPSIMAVQTREYYLTRYTVDGVVYSFKQYGKKQMTDLEVCKAAGTRLTYKRVEEAEDNAERMARAKQLLGLPESYRIPHSH
jgi:hypothetical protein